MPKSRRPKRSKPRKGGRRPVAFVESPDTGLAIQGLRVHKPTGRYYRIADDAKSRHYYPKAGRVGLAYLRRSIYEHECWQNGQSPTDSVQIIVTEPAHDDFGSELPVVGTFDDDGNPVNVMYVGKSDIAAYVREQLSNPATRKEFAEMVGLPELQNIHSLPPVVGPLSLQAIIERYAEDKTFAYKRQTTDARTIWSVFAESVTVDSLEDITNEMLQRYKKAVESRYALRTQKNHYDCIQSILSHAAAVFRAHRAMIQSQKLEFRLNCQNWSQDKKRKAKRSKAKPMKPEVFRKMLAQARGQSKLAYALYLSAANFAMHGKEATDIRHDDLDFDSMWLSSYREKDSVQRVAVIWNETAKAIKAFLESDENHNDPEFLFSDANGKTMNINSIVSLNRKLREEADLSDSVKFDGIRSMTSTAMGAENLIAQKWVMGHTTGELDGYTIRAAKETKRALMKARRAILRD